uniref:Chemotaxis protein CheA n=1 Tax=Candidatus Caldatribacterium californiense TaxID=1454726 RepID=A0A7V3YID3_9BACT
MIAVRFSPEDVEILAGILEEAPDYLSNIEEQILALEKGQEKELLDSIFRSFHSLKGIAGFVNLVPIVEVCHRAEDLIKELKSGKRTKSPALIDALLEAADFVDRVLHRLREAMAGYSGGVLEVDFEDLGERDVLAKIEQIPPEEQKTEEAEEPLPVIDRAFAEETLHDFLAELEDNLVQAEETLLALEHSPESETVSTLMRAFHSMKGGARLVLSLAPQETQERLLRAIEEIAHRLEDYFQEIREGKVTITAEVCEEAYRGIDLVRELSRLLKTGASGAPWEAVNAFLRPQREQRSEEVRTQTESGTGALEAFGNIMEQFLELLDDKLCSPSLVGEELQRLAEVVQRGLVRLGRENDVPLVEEVLKKSQEGDTEALKNLREQLARLFEDIQAAKDSTCREEAAQQTSLARTPLQQGTAHTVRVDSEKLERMLNLVGELLALKNATRSFVKQMERDSSPLLPEAKNIASGLERLSADFQSMVFSLRMVPIGELFSRYRRTVRDLAKSLGKKVTLLIEGGETELDRTVIEKLSDPLTHLVRNAVDHGIEPPEEREHLGKPPEGTIILRAYYRGAYTFVEVEDDGRGVDVQAVRVKAVDRGLVSSDEVLRLSDEEVLSFLFLPGFSTARVVSDVSGRGVGMDVVKTNIESMGGQVGIESVPQRGTRIWMRIPLSLLVVRGLMVRIAHERYILPLEFVRETVKVPPERVREYFNGRFVEVRGEILPLVVAEEVLFDTRVDLRGKGFDFNLVPLVVLGGEGETCAVAVDAFLEEGEYLMKAVPEYMRGNGVVSGVTIMGDGSIVVILNPPQLVQW